MEGDNTFSEEFGAPHNAEEESEEMEEEMTPCEVMFRELAVTWLEQNAIRVLQDCVNKKPALKRQRASLNSSQYVKK